jgi:hypothetical protein
MLTALVCEDPEEAIPPSQNIEWTEKILNAFKSIGPNLCQLGIRIVGVKSFVMTSDSPVDLCRKKSRSRIQTGLPYDILEEKPLTRATEGYWIRIIDFVVY